MKSLIINIIYLMVSMIVYMKFLLVNPFKVVSKKRSVSFVMLQKREQSINQCWVKMGYSVIQSPCLRGPSSKSMLGWAIFSYL